MTWFFRWSLWNSLNNAHHWLDLRKQRWLALRLLHLRCSRPHLGRRLLPFGRQRSSFTQNHQHRGKILHREVARSWRRSLCMLFQGNFARMLDNLLFFRRNQPLGATFSHLLRCGQCWLLTVAKIGASGPFSQKFQRTWIMSWNSISNRLV